jgi:hypothetical protein
MHLKKSFFSINPISSIIEFISLLLTSNIDKIVIHVLKVAGN